MRLPIPTKIKKQCPELLPSQHDQLEAQRMEDRLAYPQWICPVESCNMQAYVPYPPICWDHSKRMVEAAVPNR